MLKKGRGWNRKIVPILNPFSVSPLFYNFLLSILPKLGVSLDDLKKVTKLGFRPADYRVSLVQLYHLWTGLEKVTGRTDIGMVVADLFSPDRSGIVGELFFNSPNLREAFRVMERFLSLILNNISIKYEEYSHYSVFYFDMAPTFLVPFSAVECYVKICYNWASRYLEIFPLPVEEVAFRYPLPPHYRSYQQFIPLSRFYFNQPENYAILKRELFHAPNRRGVTPFQYTILRVERKAREEFATSSFTQLVSCEILTSLPNGEATIEMVADRLNLSTTTLKKRLKEEGSTFSILLDNTRRRLAKLLIEETDYSFEEIAYLLGYAKYPSFLRACYRWFGESPSRLRRG